MESANSNGKKVKNPENMSTEELIEFADEMKKGITVKLLSDLEELRKRNFLKGKGVIKAKA